MDQPPAADELGIASNDLAPRVLAALAAAGSRDSVDEVRPTQRGDLLKVLFAVSPANSAAGVQAIEAVSQDEPRESLVPPSVDDRLAVLFGSDATTISEAEAGPAPVPARIVATWQELLAGPPHEATEGVDQSTTQPENAQRIEQTLNVGSSGESAEKTHGAGNEADPSNAASAAGQTNIETQADADSSRALSSPESKELVLVNPPNGGGTIRYLVNGHAFTMPSGHSQRLPGGREWRIHFHRGGDFDDVEMVLRSGTYEFRASEAGWQLWAVDVAPVSR